MVDQKTSLYAKYGVENGLVLDSGLNISSFPLVK